jgi:hypothetical protein
MEHLIDLDALAGRIRDQSAAWSAHAEVGPLTWRDQTAEWPKPTTQDRESVRVPESLGFRMDRSPDILLVVAWIGGWFDIDMLKGEEIVHPFAEFKTLDEAMGHIERVVEEFLN